VHAEIQEIAEVLQREQPDKTIAEPCAEAHSLRCPPAPCTMDRETLVVARWLP
jgi:hypothetical protein